MKLKSVLYASLFSLLPSLIFAAEEEQPRWFEIEVILFSHIDDKSELKEYFPPAKPLTSPKRVFELLPNYLQPELSELKRQLPYCDGSWSYDGLTSNQNSIWPEQPLKTLAEIEQLATFQLEALPTENAINEQQSSLISGTDAALDLELSGVERHTMENSDETNNETSNELTSDTLVGLTDAERLALHEANSWLATQQFPYTNIPLFKAQLGLCHLSAKQIAALKAEITDFNPDGFTVERTPAVIDAAEDPWSENAYLLSANSLQLNDIVLQLKRSRSFRPLMHLGWRQVPKTERLAESLHLFAGDNLTANYQQKLKDYQQQLAEIDAAKLQQQQLAELTASLVTEVSPQTNQPAELTAEQRLEKLKTERITTILQTLANFDQPLEQTMAELDSKQLALEIAQSDELPAPPAEPLQPWYLDGFFQVHLDHYLYITANFNLLSQTLAEQATSRLGDSQLTESLKAINFSQNRRVISGEIHYFDHPYMGMVVQIRRYTPPERSEENAPQEQ